MSLSPSQADAANHSKGHAKVIAGAGSGKTHTMVEREHNLIQSGIQPEAICTIMYNTDAADGFENRLKGRLNSRKRPFVKTFHSFCSQFLIAKLVEHKQMQPAKLETSDWALRKMCQSVLEPFVSDKKKLFSAACDFVGYIDLCKSVLAEPLHVFRKYEYAAEKLFYVDAFRKFERIRINANVRYFSDLIYDPIKFLIENPQHTQLVANWFDHIIVDEFQDINDIQFTMLKIIAGARANVMVVGDDDQCIYGWRGANPQYMISGFDKEFKDVKTFELPETFRYGPQLSMAAYSLISNNQNRTPKLAVSSVNSPDTQLTIDAAVAGQKSVCTHIERYLKSNPGATYNEIAVLVRAFSHAVPVEIALLEKGIPYIISGGKPLFEAPDVGAVMSGLYVISHSYETLHPIRQGELASRFASYPHLGLEKEKTYAMLNKIRKEPNEFGSIIDDATFDADSTVTKSRMRARIVAWKNLECCNITKPGDAIRYVMNELAIEHDIVYSNPTKEDQDIARERFEAIIAYAEQSGKTLIEFVDHVTQLMQASSKLSKSKEIAVTITSIHRAKGLEWPLVILPNLCEGKFPLIRAGVEPTLELFEDERRLFYVAFTRAINQIVLIAPQDPILLKQLGIGSDQIPEMLEPGHGTASRFLYELNVYLCQQASKLINGERAILTKVKSPLKVMQYLVRHEEIRDQYKALSKQK